MAVLPFKSNPGVFIGCVRAGVKGTVSEEPIASSLEDLDRMVVECHVHGVPYQAGNVDRNYQQFWVTRDIIASGELGRS